MMCSAVCFRLSAVKSTEEGRKRRMMCTLDGERESAVKHEIVETLRSFADDNGLRFMDNYSGRWMFGRECTAIVVDNMMQEMGRVFEYVNDVVDHDRHVVERIVLDGVRGDSLGKQYVLYWPELSNERTEEETVSV